MHTLPVINHMCSPVDFKQGQWWSVGAKMQRLIIYRHYCRLFTGVCNTLCFEGMLGLDSSVCLCFGARWPTWSLHRRLPGHAVYHGIDGRVQRCQGVGENQPGPELGKIVSPYFPYIFFTSLKLSLWAPSRLHFQRDKDFSGGRACRIDYNRRLCVLTAALCRRSPTVHKSFGHGCVNHKRSVWPLDTPC